jgi:hypothetical protein
MVQGLAQRRASSLRPLLGSPARPARRYYYYNGTSTAGSRMTVANYVSGTAAQNLWAWRKEYCITPIATYMCEQYSECQQEAGGICVPAVQ